MLSSPGRLGSREEKKLIYLVPAAALWLMTDFTGADAHAGEAEDSGRPHGTHGKQEAQQEGTQQHKGRQGNS